MGSTNLCLQDEGHEQGFYLPDSPVDSIEKGQFLKDVVEGLNRTPKQLPCKYFYDQRGSELFESICETAEYYVTRTETALLAQVASEISELLGPGCELLEFGSGAGEKIRILLDHLSSPSAYIPMDISREILLRSCDELASLYPDLCIKPWVGDYTSDLSLKHPSSEDTTDPGSPRRVVFFPGSTISNFTPDEARDFLVEIRQWLGRGGVLLIGVDLVKSEEILNAAYNDAQGVTAEFNLNLVRRISTELDTDLDPEIFSHLAFFNTRESRIEMHLVASQDREFSFGGTHIEFKKGERIHTENSYKYRTQDFQNLAINCGFSPEKVWTDQKDLFSFHYLSVA